MNNNGDISFSVSLPLSKSIVQRQLIIDAINGNNLQDITFDNACNDIQVLRQLLITIILSPVNGGMITLDCKDNGTALRFLTAYCAMQQGKRFFLTGCNRLQHRPIRQLVDALRQLGADISYTTKEGYAPLIITGKKLQGGSVSIDKPQSTQFISALMLCSPLTTDGIQIQTECSSPYIALTRAVIDNQITNSLDWSAAAFWYELLALHGGEIVFKGLHLNSGQADEAVVGIFSRLGILTTETDNAVAINKIPDFVLPHTLDVDFSDCPDLYPAVYATCHKLKIQLKAIGTERLQYKESNRLEAMSQMADADKEIYHSYDDHRIAMALTAADMETDDYSCIKKSYPNFIEQWSKWQILNAQTIIPTNRLDKTGSNYVFDEGKGKKYALHKGIDNASSYYVWLRDDDVSYSKLQQQDIVFKNHISSPISMFILPLTMTEGNGKWHEHLQQTEYVAIQSLTMLMAEKGKAVMCSGANLIVNRRQWLRSYSDLHTEMASGDDMFLLESFKRRKLRVEALCSEHLTAVVSPQPTLRRLFRQRTRWAGKAAVYRDKDILLAGVLTVAMNVLALLCPLFCLVIYVIALALINKGKHYGLTATNAKSWALLLAFVYPLYSLCCLIAGLVRPKKKW